ncbi:SIMPL domain-containing protein [Rickettsia sp. TH2014]|uniref:SIMPL domain-containing protein n=1 Tax=Rickettsia sp. TH2014 TaxID=1967503 RepID=UPI001C47CE61|nr:SIMPL domain-containing protein [Rickettsia sp. TH2014]
MSKIIASFIIAAGIIISASLVSNSFLKAKLLDRTVVVLGLAEKEVSADLAIWPITIAATGNNLSEINKKIETDRAAIISFLVDQGFNKEEISLGNYQLNDLMINS